MCEIEGPGTAGMTVPMRTASKLETFAGAFLLRFPLQAADAAHIVYLSLVAVLLVLFRENLAGWQDFFSLHIAGLIAVFGVAWAAGRQPASRPVVFFHNWYHLAIFLLLFEEVHWTVHLLRPDWLDSRLIRFELTCLGVHPTVWLDRFAGPFLTEYMNFAYFSYFLLIPAAGAIFIRMRRREAVPRMMFACALGYYACYLLFLLFPIEGPAHTLGSLQTAELKGWVFTWIVNRLEGFGRVHGAAFPSAHVTAATVVLVFLWFYAKRTAWVFTVIVISLCISTVYLRYHYASDVPAGILVGTVAAAAALFFTRDGGAR
jgi:membrane-associated phospholipid phosphatase